MSYDLIDLNTGLIHPDFYCCQQAHAYAWEHEFSDYLIFQGKKMIEAVLNRLEQTE